MNKSIKEYYKRLDWIRIISCIMVLFYHLKSLKGGFLAVCTFFVLSGYLTCISAMNNREFSIKKYYINKLKKLYIPLIIVISITVILAKCIPNITWTNLKPETLSVIWGYNNFWQLKANLDYFTRHVNSPFMHFWYIAILMQFDLAFPIIFVILRKLNKKVNNNISTIIVFLLTIISTILFFYMSKTQDIMIVYYNTFARSFSLFWGILLALLQYKHDIRLPRFLKLLNKLIFIVYILILINLCIFISSDSSNYEIYMIFTTIISVRLITYSVISKNKIEEKKLLDKVIAFFAKFTYEIYLVQYPIIFFMQKVPINNTLKTLIIIFLTVVISYILYIFINDFSKNKLFKIIKNIFLGLIITIGCYLVIIEVDNSEEMKELEFKLSENSKIIEEKNNEYMNIINLEKIEDVEIDNQEDNIENIENEEKENLGENSEIIKNEEINLDEIVRQLPVVGVGDSVLLGAIDELYNVFPNGYFDGKVSRSIRDGEKVLNDLKDNGKLGNILILALANNSDYFEWRLDELMEIIGDREVYWVDAVLADDPHFNENFKVYASNHSNIHIVEWEEKSKDHPEYFYADGIHVKGEGVAAYANLIYDTIYNNYLEKK